MRHFYKRSPVAKCRKRTALIALLLPLWALSVFGDGVDDGYAAAPPWTWSLVDLGSLSGGPATSAEGNSAGGIEAATGSPTPTPTYSPTPTPTPTPPEITASPESTLQSTTSPSAQPTPAPTPMSWDFGGNASDSSTLLSWVQDNPLGSQRQLEALIEYIIEGREALQTASLDDAYLQTLGVVLNQVAVRNSSLQLMDDMAQSILDTVGLPLTLYSADPATELLQAADSWQLALQLSRAVLQDSQPGFSKRLLYAANDTGYKTLGISLARTSPDTPVTELLFGGSLNISLPLEVMQNLTEEVDLIALGSIRAAHSPNPDDFGVLSDAVRVSARSSQTQEPISLSLQSQPLYFSQILRTTVENPREYRAKCKAWDDSEESYSERFCLSRPMSIPPNTRIEWNPSYRIPEPFGKAGDMLQDYEPPYFVFGYDEKGQLRDCRTVSWRGRVGGDSSLINKTTSLPNPLDESQNVFGAIDFEGKDCPWKLDFENNVASANNPCAWDVHLQTFHGPLCTEEAHAFEGIHSIQHCMCWSFNETEYRIFGSALSTDVKVHRTFSRLVSSKDYVSDNMPINILVGLSIATIVAIAISVYWQRILRQKFMLKCMRAELGFQLIDCFEETPNLDAKNDMEEMQSLSPELSGSLKRTKRATSRLGLIARSISSRNLFKQQAQPLPRRYDTVESIAEVLSDESKRIWTWDMSTSAFMVIADDLEEYIKLSPAKQRRFPFFGSSMAHLCAAAGLPPNRIMAAIPSASNLSWKPTNPAVAAGVAAEQWVDLCLGTSMMMAFLQVRDIIDDEVADKQLDLQSWYFDGCNDMGFRELVLRWKVMLDEDNLYANGWYQRASVWKIIWLQKSNGLWELNDDFALAIGSAKDMLLSYIICPGQPTGKAAIESALPNILKRFCATMPELAMQIWCSAIALAYLEEEEEMYESYTGWEPDGANDGYSATVLATIGLQTAMEAANTQITAPRDKEGLTELLAEVEQEALQYMRSAGIMKLLRMQKTASEHLTAINARKKALVSNTRNRTRSKQRKQGIGKKDLITLKGNLERQAIARSLAWAAGEIGDAMPSTIEKMQKAIWNYTWKPVKAAIKNHGVLRIILPSPMDDFSQEERMIVFSSTVIFLMAMNMILHYMSHKDCCIEVREVPGITCNMQNGSQYGLDSMEVEVCKYEYYEPKGIVPPLNVNLTQVNHDYLISQKDLLPCRKIIERATYLFPGEQCSVTLNPYTSIGRILLALTACAAYLPFKILLRWLFALDDIKFANAFWRRPEVSLPSRILSYFGVASKQDVGELRSIQRNEELARVKVQRDAFLMQQSRGTENAPTNDGGSSEGHTEVPADDRLDALDKEMELSETDSGGCSATKPAEYGEHDGIPLCPPIRQTRNRPIHSIISAAASSASLSRTSMASDAKMAESAGATSSMQQSDTLQAEQRPSPRISDNSSLSTLGDQATPPARLDTSRSRRSPAMLRKERLHARRHGRNNMDVNGVGGMPLIAPTFSRMCQSPSPRKPA